MRRWLRISGAAGAAIADRPSTWLSGALTWICTVGWVPLVIGVARPPSEGDLVFLGARIFGSALWPWNAVAICAGLLALAAVASALAAMGEAALLDELSGRPRRPGVAARLLGISTITALPAVVATAVLAVAVLNVAPQQFSAPDGGGGPFLRTLAAVAPLVVLLVLAVGLGGALAAAASRLVHARGDDPGSAVLGSPRLLASGGSAALVQLVVTGVVRIAALVVAAILLRVLWEPVGVLLGSGGIDIPTLALLVGFVAIWLCLVLAGGALHAWASAGWSILLTGQVAGAGPDRRRQETPIDR